jgi:hypothetical protein
MKNTIRLIGIIAFIVIIGFSMITCDGDNGDDNGGGGGGSPEPTCAQTMECYMEIVSINDEYGMAYYYYYASSYRDCEDECVWQQAIASIIVGEYTCNCK